MQPRSSAWALSRVFSPAEVAAALAVLAGPGSLYGAPALEPYTTRRSAATAEALKTHLEIPLRALAVSAGVRAAIPPPVMRVYAGLLETAMSHTRAALEHPSVPAQAREGILDDIERRSVLRLLRYDPGVGCRPHVDPGLATCLLLGSQAGLEVNTVDPPGSNRSSGGVDTLSVEGKPGNYRYEAEDGTGDCEGCNRLDKLPGWCAVAGGKESDADGDVLVMNGNMLQVISRRHLTGVLHRVRYDWAGGTDGPSAAPELSPRCNIILELRPAKSKRWYALLAETKKVTIQ